jgi:NAD(P)-dependent dehydrogenase (short-subunit alcohol dehydrogenase family)
LVRDIKYNPRDVKRVFLTGVSSGIGRAIAERLCAQGYQVWGTSRDRQRVPQISGLHAVELDLSDRESIAKNFSAALAEAGHFDVVVNNAGSGQFGPSAELPNELLSEQFQVLVFGQIQLCQLALRAMRQRGEGLIINVSSLASRLPVPYMGAYNAAKAAMASFTFTLQLELKSSGIRVVDLQPADINTPFNDAVTRTPSPNAEEEARVAHAWKVVDQNLKAAPPPKLVAQHVARLIEAKNPPPLITVGNFFQASVATFIFRLLPQRVRIWGLKKYYKL